MSHKYCCWNCTEPCSDSTSLLCSYNNMLKLNSIFEKGSGTLKFTYLAFPKRWWMQITLGLKPVLSSVYAFVCNISAWYTNLLVSEYFRSITVYFLLRWCSSQCRSTNLVYPTCINQNVWGLKPFSPISNIKIQKWFRRFKFRIY